MPTDFNRPDRNRTAPQSKQANLAAKTPALEQLAAQIASRGETMESDARAIVQQSMTVIRDRVRMAVSEELEAVADDADFFGFQGMFDDTPDSPQPLGASTDILEVAASSVTL
jgi:hypothetical protein